MANVVQYVQETVDLSVCVNQISQHLSKQNNELNQLTEQLEFLFTLFSRGDELLKIMQQYSSSLQQKITNVKKIHTSYEKVIEDISVHMNTVSNHLQSITALLKELHVNAGAFVTSAQALGHLAKNTEIKAHHARREGKGLGIIAKECLSLAKQAQLPFKDFSTLLQSLEETAQPVMHELSTVIELSDWSRTLLDRSLTTLQTIDEATSSLSKIVKRVEESSAINKSLRANVESGLGVLKQQITKSLNAIDDLSGRCSHIQAQAQILNSLGGVQNLPLEQLTSMFRQKQFEFFLKDNVRSAKRFSEIKKIPGFPRDVYEGIVSMEQQITDLQGSLRDLNEYRENVGSGMSDVIELAKQVMVFLEKAQTMFQYLHTLGNDLHSELLKVEELVRTTTKIFDKIKTLSTFARIEEGRSIYYRTIMASIVESFIMLEAETEQAFASIAPKLARLKKHVQFLCTQTSIVKPEALKYPDYSKIKLFLDDIVRVFTEEQKYMTDVVQQAQRLYRNNAILDEDWHHFTKITTNIQSSIQSLSSRTAVMDRSGSMIKPSKSKITICLPNDPITLKPDLKTDITSHQVVCNMLTGLFQFGEGVDIIPALCENYDISEDGMEYTFVLRKNLKFQNGKPVRIEHIKEAFIKALEGPNFGLFDMIIGAKEFIATKNRSVLGTHIINNTTLKLRLEYPFLPILANCATNIADPYLEGTYPIGAGPFSLVDYEKGKNLILYANDHYYAGRPCIDELHFRIIEDEDTRYDAFQNGKVDILQLTGDVLDRIHRENPNVLKTIAELSIQYLIINCQKQPFTNTLVRKALCHAIDTSKLVQLFSKDNAIAAKGLFPPSMKVFNQTQKGYPYSPKLARDLLTQAGYKNGLPDVYMFDVRDSPSTIRRAEYVRASLTDIGIRVNINPMPWNEMLAKQYAGDSILSFGGWVGDNGDPDNFVYPLFHTSSQGQSGNTFFFGVSEIDALMDKARRIRNVDQRIKLYREIEQRIIDQAPCVFLYHRLQNISIQKSISGFKPHPLGFLKVKHTYASELANDPKKITGHGNQDRG